MKRLRKMGGKRALVISCLTWVIAGGLAHAQRAPMLIDPPTQAAADRLPATAPAPAPAPAPASVSSPLAEGSLALPDTPTAARTMARGAQRGSDTSAMLIPVLPAAQPRMARAAEIASERATGDDLGRATRALFALQASNEAAGPALPMLGSEVSVAYKRYLDSFAIPVPQFFEQKVKSGSSGSGS